MPFSFFVATLAAMSTFHPPRQARARATLERIFEATVELLEDQPFEALSVADIVARANTSVGAFYKRFSSKEALLPVLVDWIHRQQFEAIEAFISDPRWQGVGLAARIEEFVDSLVQSYCRHRFLMKALVARQYSADNEQSAEQIDSAERTLRYYIDWLLACRDEIRHPDPEVAVAIGLTGLVTQAQTRLLFGARSIELSDETFTEELKRAFLAYLRDPNHAPA
ncbi:MAG: TetR/AcrR family transcriptional regulator [Candidatus Wenzhouxiangella sp. M2_3B_020]